jgi:phosphoglycerate dehydrogenase-like enzyme
MNKLRCAVLDDYQHAALTSADWSPVMREVEVRAIHHHLDDEEQLAGAIGDCQIVVLMRERTPFSASMFERLRHLKLVVTTGMKNASIDLAAAHAHNVVVCGTASRPEPPAELTWALMLALARHVVPEVSALRAGGRWQSTVGADLGGQTLGLLGLGRIGARVARVAHAFDMNTIAWSQNLTADLANEERVQLAASREALLEQSDFVSVHLVLSDRTRGLLGAQELKRMKPSAYLVNTSRAAIVDQEALVTALRVGWIAGAAVDVFEEEPLPKDHVLRTLPNLLATPHLGYVTRANYGLFYREAVEDIAAFLAGAPIRVLTNSECRIQN